MRGTSRGTKAIFTGEEIKRCGHSSVHTKKLVPRKREGKKKGEEEKRNRNVL